MAFRRSRRSNRRGARKSLSTRKIFSSTGAKAQARQIYALRRGLSRVNRKLKPEIKVTDGTPASFSFNSGAVSDIWNGFGVIQPTLGTNANQRVGDKIYEKVCNFQMYFEYYNTSSTGYHNGESSGATVRIFVVQHKSAGLPTETHNLDEFILNPSNSGAPYNILPVKPFANNITNDWKIMYNKVFTMTTDRNQKLIKFNVHPGTLRFDVSGNHKYIKCYVVVSGLHYDQDFTEYVDCTVNAKLVYTDS